MEKESGSSLVEEAAGQKYVSESETSVSMSDTDAYTSNDEGGSNVKKKKKKKKKHRRKKNRESDTSDDEGGKKKRRKKKKKKRRKKKKRDSASDTGDSTDDESAKPSRRGGNSTTDMDSDGPQIAKRAPKKSNRGGLKTDPTEWSKEDLMDKVGKFATFKMDKKTGAATLTIEEKKILDESMKVLKELFNRNTEIQFVSIKKCFLVDDTFAEIMEFGIMRQRHIKALNLSGNALTKKSTALICDYFMERDEKPLESLDVRDVILNAQDMRHIYETLPRLKYLNGIDLIQSKGQIDLDLSGKKLKTTEISIVCCLTRESPIIKRLNLSKNYVDSDSLHVLADMIAHTEEISGLNLSLNPLSNAGEDHSGSLALARAMQRSNMIVNIDVVGGKLRKDIEESILRSAMINRSVVGAANPMKFREFLDKKLEEAAPPEPVYHLDGWMPSLQVDPAFLYSKQNAARNRTVEVRNDKIILPRR
mmetsp:Transcript_310/g.711  ORF Transcript_310/g.711 Transcript_310/m.711 type:complete len:477 (+) Transcript_310:48-1478(+)